MKWFYSFFVCIVFIVASCTVEEYDDTTTVIVEVAEPEIIIVNDIVARSKPSNSNDGLEIGCVTIIYPFEVVTSDTIVYLINSNNDFEILENQTNISIVDFKYPLNIVDNIGLIYLVNDLWELATHFSSCYPDSSNTQDTYFPAYLISFNNSCYMLKYPLSLQDENNKLYTAQTENELIVLLAERELFFSFPLALISQEQTEKYISSTDELIYTLYNCNNLQIQDTLFNCPQCFEYINCYRLIYPVDIKINNHDLPFRVNSPEMMEQVFQQGKFVDFVYPINLENSDGQTLVIDNEEELDEALNECIGFADFFALISGALSEPVCYDLVFPIQSIKPDGQIETYYNMNDIFNVINNNPLIIFYNVVFPVDVIIKKNNTQRKLNESIDIFDLLNEC